MIDGRVYRVQVCASCLAQVELSTIDGDWDPCPHCDGLAGSKEIRFRVSSELVLKQADPHASLVERTVYFGCVERAGHYYWNRGSGGRPYKAGRDENATPWGLKVDGGLLPKGTGIDLGQGVAHIVHEHGWTAVVFADSSVDSRPGSWSVFCIPDTLDGPEALTIARAAFPTIFERYQFEVRLAVR